MIEPVILENLEKKGRPIHVGLIGAGFAATGFALQCTRTKGMHLVSVANRSVDRAKQMLKRIGALQNVDYSDDPTVIIENKKIDVVVEATGDVEFGANICLRVVSARKHIVLINAELDCTLGPILKKKADKAGVIYTQADGDQPGVIMNLIREAESLGLKPVLAGNIKTYLDHYRNPETERDWAKKKNQRATLATSAVDGTKIAAEMATVANATGFGVIKRGMLGLRVDRVDQAQSKFELSHVAKNKGFVDYIIGAQPNFGVFIIARSENPLIRQYLNLYKMGEGPLYTLYRPFHLCTLEAHKSVLQAVLYNQATLAPKGLYCEVIAVAKRELKQGDMLDGIGGFTVYGVIEKSRVVRKSNLLPIGLSKGCILKKTIKKDSVITLNDVTITKDRLVDKLYKEQQTQFHDK